eukprot:JP436607.1.p1 GENE.JP436607.1~~JP436607.1.p1  ORF type:complete len:211 (+),score=63.21 JP436607.1:47-634(+)
MIVTQFQSRSATLTRSGGNVEIPGLARLTFMENALSQDTVVTVAQKKSTELPSNLEAPASDEAISSIYELTPHGQQFSEPVEVAFPALKSDGSEGSFYMLKASGPEATFWEHVEGQVSKEGWIKANVTSFSYFVVIEGGVPIVAVVLGSLGGVLLIAGIAAGFYYRNNPGAWDEHKSKVFGKKGGLGGHGVSALC